jgi:hypothetical protein
MGTPPPPKKGKVERIFASLYMLMHSYLNHAKLQEKMQKSAWAEAANDLTIVHNATVQKGQTTLPQKPFFGNICMCILRCCKLLEKSEWFWTMPTSNSEGN